MSDKNIYAILKDIKAFVFDIDGVLTSGNVLVTEEGYMLRSVNIKDGYALQHAVKQNVIVAIISGGKSEGMKKRFEGLGLTDIFLGQSNKLEAFDAIKKKYNIGDADICYCGDDMPDWPLLKKVGLSVCPLDACEDVKDISMWTLPIAGGDGCARFILEKFLKLNDIWNTEESHTW